LENGYMIREQRKVTQMKERCNPTLEDGKQATINQEKGKKAPAKKKMNPAPREKSVQHRRSKVSEIGRPKEKGFAIQDKDREGGKKILRLA